MIYKLEDSIDKKEIGCYPQTVGSIRQGNILVGHQGKYEPPPHIDKVVPPHIVLNNKAKRTDYVGSAGSDNTKKTISPRFYDFIKHYLSAHQTWNIDMTNDVYRFDRKKSEYVLKDNVQLEYYDYLWLHISYPEEHFICYEQSEFFLDDRDNYLNSISMDGLSIAYMTNPKHEPILIKSREAYTEQIIERRKNKHNQKVIVPKKIMINISTIEKDSMFRVTTPINNLAGYYVTETLKNKIQEQDFSGMAFTKIEDLNSHLEITYNE